MKIGDKVKWPKHLIDFLFMNEDDNNAVTLARGTVVDIGNHGYLRINWDGDINTGRWIHENNLRLVVEKDEKNIIQVKEEDENKDSNFMSLEDAVDVVLREARKNKMFTAANVVEDHFVNNVWDGTEEEDNSND